MAHEEKEFKKDGKTYVSNIDTTTYEKVEVTYPLGFKRTKLVKVNLDEKGNPVADAPAEKKKLTKKQKAGIFGLIAAGLIGGAMIKNHHDNSVDEDYGDDYEDVDDEDEESDEDSED